MPIEKNELCYFWYDNSADSKETFFFTDDVVTLSSYIYNQWVSQKSPFLAVYLLKKGLMHSEISSPEAILNDPRDQSNLSLSLNIEQMNEHSNKSRMN